MPVISFAQNKFPEFQVEPGANLMAALLAKGLPVASSCLGEGVCGKCRVEFLDGLKNIVCTPKEQIVRERQAPRLAPTYRLSCQTTVQGDICIDTSYW